MLDTTRMFFLSFLESLVFDLPKLYLRVNLATNTQHKIIVPTIKMRQLFVICDLHYVSSIVIMNSLLMLLSRDISDVVHL